MNHHEQAPHHEQSTPSPWSREAEAQQSAVELIPHATETMRDEPVLNYYELDIANGDRAYVNMPITRSNGDMDPGWSQVAEALSPLTDEHRPIMKMEKRIINDEGKEVTIQKWVDTEKALERAAEYRRQQAQADLARTAVASEVVAPEPTAAAAEEAPETELEKFERFVREGRQELSDLYEDHRNALVQYGQGSYEVDALENRIKQKKQDISVHFDKARKLSS